MIPDAGRPGKIKRLVVFIGAAGRPYGVCLEFLIPDPVFMRQIRVVVLFIYAFFGSVYL
jgi:hypothetical protein